MTDSGCVVFEYDDGRQASTACIHGEVFCFDAGPRWTEEQLVDFAQAALSARARCDCFGQRTWLPPATPEHVELKLRLYEVDQPDPDVETVRPVAIPGRAISQAAERVFETRIPASDHGLDADWRLVRLWWRQRQLGLLRDDDV